MIEKNLPILYSFKRCPYAIRARVALAFAKINHIHREINLKDKHPLFLKTSPKGTVPVLCLPNMKNPIDESVDIVVFAFKNHLPSDWQPVEILNDTLAKTMYKKLNTMVIPAIRSIKYASDQKDNASAISDVNGYLNHLDKILDESPFIYKTQSALDVIIFPNLRQLLIHDPSWLKRYSFENVERWMNYWTLHHLFKKIFITQPIWDENQEPILINNGQNDTEKP